MQERRGHPNPPRAARGKETVTMDCKAIVILGASGDLTRRKLVPALHRLHARGELRDCMLVAGEGRTPYSDEQFRSLFGVRDDFTQKLVYHRGIRGLKTFLSSRGEFSRIIFFFALPPEACAPAAEELAAEGFGPETSLIIEKPFGSDYESAVALNRRLAASFNESQIFRNDHYLAKEAVQNILVFRFANRVFDPVWNGAAIESIQINALEQNTVSERGGYFDRAGIIRDMVQNHLMQLLCLIAMEPPESLDAEEIRRRKMDVLRSLVVQECRRGQYEGYRFEKGVAPGSDTETFAELSFAVRNERWRGVPVYMRAGKALHRTGTEIGIRFKAPPRDLFGKQGASGNNLIVFNIQPAPGIVLGLSGKRPGTDIRLVDTHMTFCYNDAFDQEIPEAYQRLLLDAVRGDHTLFVGGEETELSWRALGDVLGKGPCPVYKRGSTPPRGLPAEWADFDRFATACGPEAAG
jgi:glucose-6-phosphate 1-dehydrogenase